MKTTSKKHSPRVADDYLELILRFPLRPISTKADHDRAMKLIDELTPCGTAGDLSDGEADYLAALAHFVADFESKHFQSDLPRSTPLGVLRFLMEDRAMTPAQLGEILGSRPAASMILQGRREMSKSHIPALASYFSGSPAVFL